MHRLLSLLPTDPAARAVALGQLRHVLTALGGALVSAGVMNGDTLGQVVDILVQLAGLVMVASGFLLSYIDKRQAPPPTSLPPAAVVVLLLPLLGACGTVNQVLGAIAPTTACALDIAAAVQPPGDSHADDTAKAVSAATTLLTSADCLRAAVTLAQAAVAATAPPAPAAPPAAPQPLTPPVLSPVAR